MENPGPNREVKWQPQQHKLEVTEHWWWCQSSWKDEKQESGIIYPSFASDAGHLQRGKKRTLKRQHKTFLSINLSLGVEKEKKNTDLWTWIGCTCLLWALWRNTPSKVSWMHCGWRLCELHSCCHDDCVMQTVYSLLVCCLVPLPSVIFSHYQTSCKLFTATEVLQKLNFI